LLLEAVALFFGEEYARENEVGWPKKLGQTIWIRQVPGCGENSNEHSGSIKDTISW